MPWDSEREDYINKYDYMEIEDIKGTDLYEKSVAMIEKLSRDDITRIVKSIYGAEKVAEENGLELHDEDADVVRIAAIHYLDDQNVLAQSIIDEWDSHFICEAIEFVTDQELLLMIVEKAKSSTAQEMAASRITDQEQLIRFATEPPEPDSERSYSSYRYDTEVRIASAENIKDQKVLKKIFLTDDEEYVQEAALNNIEDEDFQYKYAMKKLEYPDHPEWGSSLRIIAVQKINDQQRLINILKNDQSSDVQRAAICKIKDQSVLLDFALQSHDHYVVKDALCHIEDQQVLIDLARQNATGSTYFFRERLIEVLTDLDTLAYMAEHDEEKWNRDQAKHRLGELKNPEE